jgi:ABC-type polysaccharide/polyol phosphate export permease
VTADPADIVDEGHPLGFRHWAGITGMLALRTFRLRYLRSKLGVGWVLVQPLVQAAVLAFIFTKVFGVGRTPHYPLYVLTGVMTWQSFSGSVNVATTAALDNASLLRKVSMPAIVFPLAQALSVLMVLLVQFVVLVAAAVIVGTVSLKLLLLPLLPMLVGLVALGVGLLAGALQVAYRDVKFLVESGLLIAFYASPVLYSPDMLPAGLSRWLELNPMFGVLSFARTIFLDSPILWRPLGLAVAESVVLLTIGAVVFRRRSRDFADLA